MLIIHVGITNRRAFAPSQTAVSTGQSIGAGGRGLRGSGKRRHDASESYAMQNIKVDISQIVEDDAQRAPRLYTDLPGTMLSLGYNDSEEQPEGAASVKQCACEGIPV